MCSPRTHSVLLHARRRLTPRWPTRARAALAVALSASTQDDRNHRALARMAGRGALSPYSNWMVSSTRSDGMMCTCTCIYVAVCSQSRYAESVTARRRRRCAASVRANPTQPIEGSRVISHQSRASCRDPRRRCRRPSGPTLLNPLRGAGSFPISLASCRYSRRCCRR